MTDQPPGAQQVATPIYRLVVTASQIRARQFIWVIMDDSGRGAPVQASKQTFRSMADAYDAGRGALEYWHAKMRRAYPAVDLGQPPAQQPRTGTSVPGRPLTSKIYSRG